MITVLHSVYEQMAKEHTGLVSVPLCHDLFLNWMLNVHDRYVYFYTVLFEVLYIISLSVSKCFLPKFYLDLLK
jgi:hypothetical protein